jgi:histone acetyltransferase SAS3
VKIKPGATDEEDEGSDDGSNNSDPRSIEDEESDGTAAWEDAPDIEDEDESASGMPNLCIFCKQDEEHDPSEEFEPFLACSSCGENGTYFASEENCYG